MAAIIAAAAPRARLPFISRLLLPPHYVGIGIGSLTAQPPQDTYEDGTTNRLHLIAGLARITFEPAHGNGAARWSILPWL